MIDVAMIDVAMIFELVNSDIRGYVWNQPIMVAIWYQSFVSKVIEQVGEGLVEDTGPTKDINICIVNIIMLL